MNSLVYRVFLRLLIGVSPSRAMWFLVTVFEHFNIPWNMSGSLGIVYFVLLPLQVVCGVLAFALSWSSNSKRLEWCCLGALLGSTMFLGLALRGM